MSKHTDTDHRTRPHLLTAWFSGALLLVLTTGMGLAQSAPEFNAADMVGSLNGVSLFRYGALGQGAYPYRQASPASPMQVTYQGVPLRSRSPFGPDLGLIPAVFADSVAFDGFNTLTFGLTDSIPTEPVTDTRFLTGSRRRFNLDVAFRRPLNEESSLTFGGSSTGMQGHYPPGTDAFIPKYNFRHYLLDYVRRLDSGAGLHVTIRGLRDRDELADLDSLMFMGERKTDEMTLSAMVNNFPVSETTTLSPVVYYQRSNTRFARYGLRKSLDENVLGVSVAADKKLGDTGYRLKAYHERTTFDSKFLAATGDYHESAIEGLFTYQGGRIGLRFDGAARYHADYEGGYRAAADVRYRLRGSADAIARAASETVYPDPGDRYYAVPSFSDEPWANLLYRGEVQQIEAGLGIPVPGGRMEILGFASRSDCPIFNPDEPTYSANVARDVRLSELPPYSAARTVSLDGMRSSGARYTLHTEFERWAAWKLTSSGAYRTDSDERALWYYPQMESRSDGRVQRTFIDGKLSVAGYGSMTVQYWESPGNGGETSPSGTRFFLDGGVSIKVASLELFYQVENVTSEDIYWFDILQWQGRNTMYGGRWIFYR